MFFCCLKVEADMKREMERKEQEKKKSPKVEFIAGGTQPGIAAVTQNISMQISVAPSAVGSRIQSVSNAADAMAKDSRPSKKSKWDKVDGDRKNSTHSGGQDTSSTSVTHAALLSTAQAGAGYTAFAQQRRREAEERRSSERRRT
ncbi:hypothetical protein GIB67_014677 [Kingdonia uniflora]|uniref:Uncharacterized protein n=1 Tax=Kingdonia uniflora TaxID=39325 RepID=A0A7J7LYE7_9MAGN|nr:hypothetical protein GIB67_014677 [Kingdonia uniflora]